MNNKTIVITATELKNNLGKYLDYAAEDHEVIISKNGKNAVRLTSYAEEIESNTTRESSADYKHRGKKLSYEEFLEMCEQRDSRMEYLNGEIVLLSSPNTVHQVISGNLYLHLRSYLSGKECSVFYVPLDVHLYKKNVTTPDVLQPDLLIACDMEEAVNDLGRYMVTPVLCIEILSKYTRSRDMVDKLNTYMLSGVQEYWIVDPDKHTVIVYSFADYDIREFTVYKSGETLRSFLFDDLQIEIKQIFEG